MSYTKRLINIVEEASKFIKETIPVGEEVVLLEETSDEDDGDYGNSIFNDDLYEQPEIVVTDRYDGNMYYHVVKVKNENGKIILIAIGTENFDECKFLMTDLSCSQLTFLADSVYNKVKFTFLRDKKIDDIIK
jgi:hypothetical protein